MKKNFSILVNKNSITSIAIGGFDGMHIAHQELFKKLDSNGAIVCIESGFANLTPNEYRQEYTSYPIYYYFLEKIKHLEGMEFIELLKKDFPNLKRIVVGYDFCFGKNRKYCVDNLKNFFKGEVLVVDEIVSENTAIHSKIIREYLKNGDIEVANKLLGKEYKISGPHIYGQGLGAKNFVPTINIKTDNFLLPKEGVYISKTILNEFEYNSITFLGHRFTTDGNYAIETHLLDKNIEKITPIVEIKFLKKIRDNQKFESFESLKKQIFEDMKSARNFFNIY